MGQVAHFAADDEDELMKNVENVEPLFVEVHDDASFISYTGGIRSSYLARP